MGTGKTYSTKYLLDSNNSSGVAGQVLSTTSTGIDWVDANAVPGSGLWLASGSNIYNSNSGNVGIGVTGPSGKLHVYNTATTSNGDGTASETAIGQDSITLYGHGGTNGQTYGSITWMGGSRRRAMISAVAENADTDYIGLVFYTQGTDGSGNYNESMRISRSGNVGIGTLSPDMKIDVEDNSTTWAGRILNTNSNGAGLLVRSDSTTASNFVLGVYGDGGYKMVVKSGGNVGIGTTGPGTKLDVRGTGNFLGTAVSGAPLVTIENNSGSTATSYGLLVIGGGDSSNGRTFEVRDASGNVDLIVKGNGNVGIGTASPLTKLHVAGTTDANIIRIENTSTSLSLGSTIGAIQFFNNDPTDDSPNVAASIYATAGASGGSGALRFKTTEPGTEGDPATDTMIITNGGRVGIGTDSPDTKLEVEVNSGTAITRTTMSAADGYRGGFEASNTHTGGSIWSMFSTNNSDGYFGGGKFVIANETMGDVDANTPALVVVNGAGNVGIGTTIGINKLDVAGNINIQGGNGSYLTFNNGDANIVINNNGTGRDLSFKTYDGSSNAERMRIDKNGNVGIGVTGPSAALQVERASGTTFALSNSASVTSGNRGDLAWYNSDISTVAQIRAGADTDNVGTNFQFFTRPVGAAIQETMRINAAGSIKFNAYDGTNNTGSPTHILGTDANGLIVKSTAGGSIGPWLPLAGGTMTLATSPLILPGEEANVFKIAFTGASASSGLSTVDQSGAGLYIGANSRLNTSGNVVYHDSALPSSGIYFDGWLGDDMEFYTGSSGNPTKRLTLSAGGDAIFTGNVGIGTTLPQRPLHVNGTEGVARFTSTASGNNGFEVGIGTSSQAFLWQAENSYMQFATSNVQRMRIDSGGSVIIGDGATSGTPTGDYRSLEIGRQGNTITGAPWKSNLYFSTNATITAASTTFTARYLNELPMQMVMEDGIFTWSNAVTPTAVGNTVSFNEKMRLNVAGELGIGTTSPDGKLHVYTSGVNRFVMQSDNNANQVFQSAAGANGYNQYTFKQMGGTIALPTQLGGGYDIGNIIFQGYDGTDMRPVAGIRIRNSDTITSTSSPGDINFETTTVGSVAVSTKMIILSSGNVGIGTTSPTDDGASATTLEVRGKSGTGGGVVRVSNAGNTAAARFFAGSASATIGTVTNHELNIVTNNSVKMVVEAGGNVGINTTSPQDKLEIKAGYLRMYDPSSNLNAGYPIRWTSDNGGTNVTFAEISGLTTSAGNRTGALYFNTSNGGAPTEKMRISAAGAIKFNAYGAGTLVTDASGNITVSSGGGAGGPFLPLAGGDMTGGIDIVGVAGGVGSAGPQINFYPATANDPIGAIRHNGTDFIITAAKGNSDIILESDDDIQILAGSGDILINKYVVHNNDLDTKFGFTADDQFQVIAGGNTNLNVQGNGVTISYQGSTRLNTQTGGVAVTGELITTGDVGIGVTNPSAKLHVDGDSYFEDTVSIASLSSYAYLNIITSDAGNGGTGQGLMYLQNTNTATSGGAMVLAIRNDYGSGFGNYIKFFKTGGSTIGEIYANSGRTNLVYSTSSDYRLKEDLKTFKAVDIINQIPVYDFKWKETDFRDYGVLAHEMQVVLPGLVKGDKDGEENQTVDYMAIVPILMQSIKELKAEIELLKQQINN